MALNAVSEGLVTLLTLTSTFAIGMMAGLFFAYSASVVLALETLAASAYTTVMQEINDAILNPVFGVVFVGSAVVPASSAAVVFFQGTWAGRYGQLVLAGTAIYLIGTIAVTMRIHIPMNEYIATWSPTAPPDDWAATRTRWARWNHVRAAAAVVAFGIYLLAIASTSV